MSQRCDRCNDVVPYGSPALCPDCALCPVCKEALSRHAEEHKPKRHRKDQD